MDNEDEAQWQGHEQLWTQVMQADGDEWTLVQLARGERLPADPFTFHGIILTGSHHGILEDAPWMQDLQCFVQKVVRGELPEGGRRPKLLAVCFGAQLLAVALGGASGPNPHGKFVFKTEAVVGTPSLLTAPGFDAEHHWHGPKEAPAPEYRLLETHGDCVLKLPEQAVLLASSPSCEHEMFSVGDSGAFCRPQRLEWLPDTASSQPALSSALHLHSNRLARSSRVQR